MSLNLSKYLILWSGCFKKHFFEMLDLYIDLNNQVLYKGEKIKKFTSTSMIYIFSIPKIGFQLNIVSFRFSNHLIPLKIPSKWYILHHFTEPKEVQEHFWQCHRKYPRISHHPSPPPLPRPASKIVSYAAVICICVVTYTNNVCRRLRQRQLSTIF